MIRSRLPVCFSIVPALLSVLLAGCGGVGAAQPPAVRSPDDASATLDLAAPAADEAAETPAVPAPTVQATLVPVPDGWVEIRSGALGISLYAPSGWEAIPYDMNKLDLRGPDINSWLEINVIGPETAPAWNLVYTPGMAAEDLLAILVAAAQEDGEFGEPEVYGLRVGGQAWTAEGSYNLLADRILIGVVAQETRALLVIGHAPMTEDGDWDQALIQTYRQILWSLSSESD